LSPTGDDHLSAFTEKAFGGGKAEAGGCTGNQRYFSFKFTHTISLGTEIAVWFVAGPNKILERDILINCDQLRQAKSGPALA